MSRYRLYYLDQSRHSITVGQLKPGLWLVIGMVLLLNGPISWAQDSNSAPEVIAELFEKPQKIQWVKHFKGRMDDLNDVALTLAFDGKQCKGVLTYLRSKERFDLVGQLRKGQLTLQEFDRDAQLSGHVQGEMTPTGINADWTNHNRSIGAKMTLEEVEREVTVPGYCGDNKWVRHYKGLVAKNKVELVLQKESNRRLSGVAYFKNNHQSYNVRGYMDIFDNVYLDLKDDYTQIIGKMEGTFGDRQKFNFTFVDPNQRENICTFHLKESLPLGCVEYADYQTNYNILYPKTQNSAFNQWIGDITNNWIQQCKDRVADQEKVVAGMRPELRASVRASAWCEIDYWSEELISGLMTFNNSWMTNQTNTPISYDLKNERVILLKDIFKADFDHRNYLRKALNKAINQHQLYEDFEYRQWLAKEDFKYFTIRKEGIRFCTKFHPIYGQQQLTIAYDDLKPFLKKKSPIEKLLN